MEKEAVVQSPERAVEINLPAPQAEDNDDEDMTMDIFALPVRRTWKTEEISAAEWRKAEREAEMAWLKWNEEDVKANQQSWLDCYAIQASKFRDKWMSRWSRYGSFDAITEIEPMHFTNKPAPTDAAPCDSLQVFSVKVAGIRGGLQWPLHVFGMVAVRDSIDQKRNIIFQRERDDSETLTEEDPFLVLTGPARAVVALDPVTFEVELKVKGTTKSEDKDLSSLAVPIESGGTLFPRVLYYDYTSKVSTLEFAVGHIVRSVEATISVQVIDGSWPDSSRCQFAVRATSNSNKNTAALDDKEVILLDTRDGKVGNIELSRRVVSVEVTGKLVISVKAWIVGDDVVAAKAGVRAPMEAEGYVEQEVVFTPREADRSEDTLDVGFCKMKVTVAWSLMLCKGLIPYCL